MNMMVWVSERGARVDHRKLHCKQYKEQNQQKENEMHKQPESYQGKIGARDKAPRQGTV